MVLSTRKITTIALLGALTAVLGITGLGLIPVPTAAGRATILHVVVILATLLEGPVVGIFVGLIFGFTSFFTAANPLLMHPVVAILPRVLIAVTTYCVFRLIKNDTLSATLSAVVGSATNTIGVLGLGVLFKLIPYQAALGVAALHGIPEAVLAAVITLLLYRIIKKIRKK
ncbi:MAG TPA: ECF transporter S component [Clostridiales bacterium]|nr:ECF transporter S component [Clostridiales bacterium]